MVVEASADSLDILLPELERLRDPFMLSVGGGIGAWFIVALVGALMPGLAGLIVILVITIKRRRWFKRQREE